MEDRDTDFCTGLSFERASMKNLNTFLFCEGIWSRKQFVSLENTGQFLSFLLLMIQIPHHPVHTITIMIPRVRVYEVVQDLFHQTHGSSQNQGP